MEKYVIIGNGTAAAACIEGIRSTGTEGSITVVSAEKHHVYCRPLISYLLEGKTDTERMLYRDADFYEANGCEVRYGKKAVRVDSDSKTVELDDGTLLPYSKLCVATGSSPFIPPFQGLDTVKEKYTFMTLDDALALQKAVKPDSRVLIMGAGLIGLKCAEGLAGRAASITVCDLADRILSSILDSEGAGIVQKHIESRGIRFILSDTAERFERDTAYLKSGTAVNFDILVLAIGVRAGTGLLKDIPGAVNRGIKVDGHMMTCKPDIFAAGDCTEGYDASTGTDRILALMPNAYFQGYCAGVNMAGGDQTFSNGIPMNSIGFFGLHVMTAGTYLENDPERTVYEEHGNGVMKKLFCGKNVLSGFILIGDTKRAGIYTAMIRNRTPLDSVNFDILKKTPTSFAYSADMRGKMFGGIV